MNDLPRQKLIEIVAHRQAVTARTGRDVLNDAKLCEALLRDLCGEHKREIFVLVAALKERVAADLLPSPNGVPREVLLSRLTQRLHDNLALTEEAARWAVDSWALALDVLAPNDLGTSRAPQISLPRVVTLLARESAPSSDAMKLTLAPGVTMDFVRVTASEFLMGSKSHNKLAGSNERPQHVVSIPYDYWIARYPVTNEQFAQFVTASKYGFSLGQWQAKPTHPVVRVSWRDAMAYCSWLDAKLHSELKNLTLRLPTEAEWEKAARGEYANEWPWGNSWDPKKCNSCEGNKGDTAPVGTYSPQGDSPYGAADMASNVWEWTLTIKKNYPYSSIDGREDPTGDEWRVVRGGSWYFSRGFARCASRYFSSPNSRDADYGFRCILSRSLH